MSKSKKKVVEEIPVVVEEVLEILSFSEATERYESMFYNELYGKYSYDDVKLSSRKERKENNYSSPSLTYGEITFSSFTQVNSCTSSLASNCLTPDVLKTISIWTYQRRKVCGYRLRFRKTCVSSFILWCKFVNSMQRFIAGLLHNFEECMGIEILENLNGICNEVRCYNI